MLSEMILFMEMKQVEGISLIDSLFFDTDCISAFLWVNEEFLLSQLYPTKIVIPQEVYKELSNPSILWMKKRIDILVNQNIVIIENIDVDSDEYEIYYKLTQAPEGTHKIIGKGEAASISLAKKHGGILASNNLKDIKGYIDEFNLKHITTADILVEAYKKGLIDEKQGNQIWKNMLQKKRKIGGTSFSGYLLQINSK